MNQYRFHLKKYDTSRRNNKLTCPECGKSNCFVKYVDEEGVIVFPDYVGRCDHENACGYHYTPKDYFHDNPDPNPHITNSFSCPSSSSRICDVIVIGIVQELVFP